MDDAERRRRADLRQAVKDLAAAIDELRDLARGIHPSILSEAGLAAALESLADRSPVPVTMDIQLATEPPPAIAAAAYFAVAEALTNIAKHAHAQHAEIHATTTGDQVHLLVVDDGIGGADSTLGSGLRGIADRVAAADGSLHVHSPPGHGTRLEVGLPCE